MPETVSVGDALRDIIHQRNWDQLRERLRELNPSDVSDLIIALPAEEEAFVFRVLSKEQAAEVFSYLPPDHQEELIASLTNEQVRSVLQSMTPDDRTRLLEEMPAEVTRRLLTTLSPDELKNVRFLLGYPEDTAGRYMTPRYVTIEPEMTAEKRQSTSSTSSMPRGGWSKTFAFPRWCWPIRRRRCSTSRIRRWSRFWPRTIGKKC